jgi:cell pole-organizing protein PopZ
LFLSVVDMSDAKPQPEPSMEEILASINRMIADDEKPGDAVARPAVERRTEVLDLTEAIDEDGMVRRITPKGPEGNGERIEPEPPRIAASEPAPPAAEPKLDPGVRDHVLSAAAAGAAAAALGRLAAMPHTGGPSQDQGRAESAHTIEDIVRDALRPLLRSWLDEHLPALAEKLAREEIARVLQKAGLR